MKQLILILLYSTIYELHTQELEANMLIGKWMVESVQMGKGITFCRSTKVQIEAMQRNLEEKFINSIFTLYSTNKIKYPGKNIVTEDRTLDLSDLSWRINMSNKIEIVDENKNISSLKLNYLNNGLIFNDLGIVLVLNR